MDAIAPRRRTSGRYTIAIGGLAAGLILAGCSPFAGGGGDDGSDTLIVTTFDAIDATILKKVGAEFTEQNPDFTVQVTQIPEDSYVTKLQTSVLADDAPDLAYMYSVGTTTLFQPLDEMLYAEHDIDPADYNAALQSGCGHDGKIFCAGGYNGTLSLYYNKKMFDEAGLPALDPTTPITFGEYADIARKVAKSDSDPSKAVWAGDPFAPAYYMDPATYLSDDGRSTELDSPEFIDAFQNVCELNREGIAPSEGQTESLVGEDGSAALFANGQLAMTIADPTTVDLLDAAGFAADDYGIAPTPVPAGGEPFAAVWTNGYGIPVGSKHPEEAAEFLALWATFGQGAHAEENLMPLLTSAAEEEFASKGPRQAELFAVTQLARESVFTPNLFSWIGAADDAMTECVQDGVDAATVLADADAKAQQGLDVSWEQFEKELAGATG